MSRSSQADIFVPSMDTLSGMGVEVRGQRTVCRHEDISVLRDPGD